MVVFQYEWKRSKKSILIWAIVLAVCIFFMTPVYYGLIGMTDSLPENFAQGGFFETVGVSLDLLMKPLGMYSFLTGFFMIAGGIFGMHFGLSLHTKECYRKYVRIFVYKTLWTSNDLPGKDTMLAWRRVCSRRRLSCGITCNDATVQARIFVRRVFPVGNLLFPCYLVFWSIGAVIRKLQAKQSISSIDGRLNCISGILHHSLFQNGK